MSLGKFAVKVNKDNIDNFTKDSENNEALETSSTGIANNEDENIDNTNQGMMIIIYCSVISFFVALPVEMLSIEIYIF